MKIFAVAKKRFSPASLPQRMTAEFPTESHWQIRKWGRGLIIDYRQLVNHKSSLDSIFPYTGNRVWRAEYIDLSSQEISVGGGQMQTVASDRAIADNLSERSWQTIREIY